MWYVLIPLAAVALDQLVKWWASTSLKAVGDIPLIEGVFHLTYAENRGAAFSILQGQRVFFLVVTVLLTILMAVAIKKNWVRGRFGHCTVLLIIGGALGNCIDRLRLGYVVDLFYFKLIDFPIFNIADIFLTVGGVMLLIYFFVFDKKLQEQAESEAAQKKELPHDEPQA